MSIFVCICKTFFSNCRSFPQAPAFPGLPQQSWPSPYWNYSPTGHLPTVPGRLPSYRSSSGHHSDPQLDEDGNESDSNESTCDISTDQNNNVENESETTKNSEDRLARFRSLFKALYVIYPDRFQLKDSVVPYYRARQSLVKKSPENTPLLKISPQLKGSWFDPPSQEHSDDKILFWKEDLGFPSKTKVNPKNFSLAAKPACPYTEVTDEALKLLFKAPAFKTADLDHSVFDKSSMDVSFSPYSKLDSLIRVALHETYVIDEMSLK